MPASPHTFVGYPTDAEARPLDDTGVRRIHRAHTVVGYAVREDATVVDPVRPDAQRAVALTRSMIDALRAKLRAAEAREAEEVAGRAPPPRVPPPRVEVALAPNSDANFYAGFDDACPDGVFVATHALHPIGTRVELDVLLPGGHAFSTTAVVEWVRDPNAADEGLPAGVGYRVDRLDGAARDLARAFCRHRAPLFFVR